MSFTTLVNSKNASIFVITGNDHTGRKAWYILLIAANKLKLFNAKISSGCLKLSQFGKIIESAYGEYPSDEVIERVRNTKEF